MKTQAHHQQGKKCLVEVYNNNKKESEFVTGKITGIVSSIDTDYRVNVETDEGVKYSECHPDCIKPYWYIAPRSAWDVVPIGPFKSIQEAEEECNKSEYSHKLIKQA